MLEDKNLNAFLIIYLNQVTLMHVYNIMFKWQRIESVIISLFMPIIVASDATDIF